MAEQPISEEYRKQMRVLAEAIDQIFNGDLKGEPRKTGFALLCFPFGDDPKGRTSYISNAERSDMLNAMKEFIARAEGRITDSESLQ